MRVNHFGLCIVAAAALALSLVIAPTPPTAIANGTKTGVCSVTPYNGIITGTSNSGHAITYISSGTCGQVGVQVRYESYVGGPQYNTAWTYGALTVTQYHSNVVRGGHVWSAGGLMYT